jgi:quercetin dioxygenase-like cupin family protein
MIVNKGRTMKNEELSSIKNLTAKVLELSNLVDYQEGSVVSRTIIDKPSGTLTLFAFAQGQGLSEHKAPFDAVVNVLDGEAEITISGKAFRLKTGEAMIMPANQPHALKAIKQFKMMLVMIR